MVPEDRVDTGDKADTEDTVDRADRAPRQGSLLPGWVDTGAQEDSEYRADWEDKEDPGSRRSPPELRLGRNTLLTEQGKAKKRNGQEE